MSANKTKKKTEKEKEKEDFCLTDFLNCRQQKGSARISEKSIKIIKIKIKKGNAVSHKKVVKS